jgi:hypothetical protein
MSRKIIIGLSALAGIVIAAEIVFIVPRVTARPVQSEAVEEVMEEEPPEPPSRAQVVINALAASYPGRIETAEFRDGDWALSIDGRWYYYAGGRMLPGELLEQADEYSPSFGVPNYPEELPPWTEPDPEQAARFRERERERNEGSANNGPRRQRSYHFQEALWQARSRDESSRQVRRVDFFGNTLMVHSGIAEALSLVQKRIAGSAETDPRVMPWINSIGTVHGWNWRNVAGSQSRSYHSYGIAIDILPKSLGGRETYWQWAAQGGREWWNIPYDKRYHPPDAVVKAFEAYGFIWGGKWQLFDTMHFEYRPEVFILNGLSPRFVF